MPCRRKSFAAFTAKAMFATINQKIARIETMQFAVFETILLCSLQKLSALVLK
jgi:hypothetical protein